jgi:G3E family GTPase
LTNVYIITGFLGAGKTTLLNQLLALQPSAHNIVIENEFGQTSIDKSLIANNFSQTVFEINQGCICCTLDTELYEVLNQIYRLDPPVDHLFIEATGIADAGVLASSFIDEQLEKHFKLQSIICVVDALNIAERIPQEPEVLRQIVAADHVYIAKHSSQAQLQDTEGLIAQLNPHAAIHTTSTEDLFSKKDRHMPMPKTETQSQHRVTSVLYETTQTFDRAELSYRLMVTLQLYYDQVYRIKGFVKLEGEAGWFLVQSTGKVLTIEKTDRGPIGTETAQLVFIGKELKTSVVAKIVKSALR